jgi:peptide/nickel transport system permease protein
MQLPRYLLGRLLQFVPVVLFVVILNFVIMKLAPGDAAYAMAGESADPAYIERVRVEYGLDRPIPEQLWRYLTRVAQGDFGRSTRYSQPVVEVIQSRLGPTLLLAGTSLLLAAVLGTLIGTVIARRAGSLADLTTSVVSVVTFSIPVFWLGLMMIFAFAISNKWFPVSGMRSILGPREGWGYILDVGRHLVLPAATLALVWLGQYVRLARSSVLQVLSEDFITTARATGFSPRAILLRHALPNALLPIVSVIGLQVGLLLGGAVLTETVFAWPGIGRVVYEALLARDTPLIMGVFIVTSICVALASLLTDLLYAALDPRVVYR